MATPRKEQVDQLWKNLVNSAFDFFEKAIGECDKAPKYAVLHLATSVELFLKSRLMAEHWALILAKESPPKFDNFCKGDFQSVTVHAAIEKINGILDKGLGVSTEAEKEFIALGNERNKIAHFFHSELGDKKQQEDIVSQQCRVWYFMHDLLDSVWKEKYIPFHKKLSELEQKMKEQREFLEVRFKNIEPELEKFKKQGFSVLDCEICEFESLVLREDKNLFNYAECEVCHYRHRVLKIKCPGCKKDIILDEGYGGCSCGYSFSHDKLAGILRLSALSDGSDHGTYSIYCPYCETGSVYPTGGDYVCLNCFELFGEISICDWCSEHWAGNELSEHSYYLGCGNCGGHGWQDDKD